MPPNVGKQNQNITDYSECHITPINTILIMIIIKLPVSFILARPQLALEYSQTAVFHGRECKADSSILIECTTVLNVYIRQICIGSDNHVDQS